MFRFGSSPPPTSTAARIKELINLAWGKCQSRRSMGERDEVSSLELESNRLPGKGWVKSVRTGIQLGWD